MKIVIMGGAGFLGNNLVRRCLLDPKNEVTVVDSLDERLKSDRAFLDPVIGKIQFIQGDLCDKELMEEVVAGKDVIFNCAGQTSHPLSLEDPSFDVQVNCIGNLTLLEAVKNVNKQALVVYTSSSTVIGRATNEVVDETHGEAPLDIYSANKGVAEKYYRIYNKVYDLKTVSLRFANLYGPFGKGYPEFGFINYFISLAEQDKAIQIYGDGAQNRNVMFVEDAADLLYQCVDYADQLIGNVYFAVHREHYSVREIAETIVEVYQKGKLEMIPWPQLRKRIEIDNVIISAAKLFYDMHFEPKYDLRSGLEKTIESMKSYHTSSPSEKSQA